MSLLLLLLMLLLLLLPLHLRDDDDDDDADGEFLMLQYCFGCCCAADTMQRVVPRKMESSGARRQHQWCKRRRWQ